MKSLKILWIWLVILTACKNEPSEKNSTKNHKIEAKNVEVQGHRGDRGNFPENSLPAFISAVEKGVDVLELDVVISKDKKVVVSHEPFMHSLYMLTPEGDSISETEQEAYNFYKMSYDSIKTFNAGSKGNRLFPEQKKQKTYKPLLAEVIDSVNNYINKNSLQPVKYNIELKSSESKYCTHQPEPGEFVKLVMKVLEESELSSFNLQSFDVNILNEIHQNYPEVETAYLVSAAGIEKNLELLNYQPEIYSPHFELVKDSDFVDSIVKKNMRLIPWTVNDTSDIKIMIKLGVDGIITDYPERVQHQTNPQNN